MCSVFFVADRDKTGCDCSGIAQNHSLIAIKFVAKDTNKVSWSACQAVDRLDVVFFVDECPANLVVHQVVDFTRIVQAGIQEDALAIHGRVSLRQVTPSFLPAVSAGRACFQRIDMV